jgi:hypothetical protein
VAPAPLPVPDEAPRAFTGPVHPYYCEADGRGAFFVVRTIDGMTPSRVAGPFKEPSKAISKMNSLNEKACDELRA